MYEISDYLRELAERVTNTHKDVSELKDKLSAIAFLTCDSGKKTNGKKIFADTQKVSDKIKAITGLDFIITFYTPNYMEMTEEQMEILMRHELLHCGYFENKASIVPHDVEDFKAIISEYGVDWPERK